MACGCAGSAKVTALNQARQAQEKQQRTDVRRPLSLGADSGMYAAPAWTPPDRPNQPVLPDR